VALGRARYFAAIEAGDWRAAAPAAGFYEAEIRRNTSPKLAAAMAQTQVRPRRAIALALGGDFAGAHRTIDETGADCYLCLRVRGNIAALEKNWGGAAYWFARAATAAPSVPFAYEDWGRMLLAKGDAADAAIAQFELAKQKGPHFADPLEGWGEALMAKNQSHLALKKFAEAEKYAPSWGRLHLKWGQALAYTGKRDEARAQFSRAAALDLTSSEKQELARFSHV
jgi:tetratricopeptide (TPR) repeat protein